uniref:Secreted protein n=1 Tax=Parascaris univalens TaxID=6257 RepID=A0A915A8C1_PARUN
MLVCYRCVVFTSTFALTAFVPVNVFEPCNHSDITNNSCARHLLCFLSRRWILPCIFQVRWSAIFLKQFVGKAVSSPGSVHRDTSEIFCFMKNHNIRPMKNHNTNRRCVVEIRKFSMHTFMLKQEY